MVVDSCIYPSVWFRAWFSYDGNFRMVRKSKKVATGDICLSDGCGYIPAKQGYKLWTETIQEPKRTVSNLCLFNFHIDLTGCLAQADL